MARLLYGPGGRLRAVWRLALYGLALVVGYVVAEGVLYPVLAALGWSAGMRLELASWNMLAAAALAHLATLRWVEHRPWRDVGLGTDDARPALLARGALVGTLAIGVPILALLGAGLLRVQPAGASGAEAWVSTAGTMLGTLAPAALFEELLVRGYPFLVLRESAGPWTALVVTSAIFGALHMQNPGATLGSVGIVTLAGIFLGAVLLATGSLWAAWAAHLAWNFTMGGLFHAAISGIPFGASGYRVVDAGPDWLTGGPWGPEGGAGAAAGMVAALSYLWIRGRRRLAGRADVAEQSTFSTRSTERGSV